jgi:diguanylate cyclase (GGDEF)-like protein
MDYFNARQYLISLPTPVFLVSVKSGKVLFANRQAEKKGFFAGTGFFKMLEDNTDLLLFKKNMDREPESCELTLRINGKLYNLSLCLCGARFNGMQSWLVAIDSMGEAFAQNAASVITAICDIFTSSALKNKTYDFLAATAKSTGAFCASLYEKRNNRYVLKEEWRERKSVCIPVLAPNFEESAGNEMERLARLKRAADTAVALFTKAYGTSGAVMYFFDSIAGQQVKRNIEKYAGLYSILSPDTHNNNMQVTARKGLDSISLGFAIWDPATREMLYNNKAYKELFGCKNSQISGELGEGIKYRSKTMEESLSDSRGSYYSVTHTPAKIGGQEIIATVISDVTKYRETEAKLEAMARTDTLTGLLNRRAGTEALTEIYEECRKKSIPLTVCFADIDGLKLINDTYGHGAGDVMIKSVAEVLRKYADKTGTVCRLGGDEFVLILPGFDRERAKLVASQIERDIKKCLVGESQGISMSFGFKEAEYFDGESAGSLVSYADHDMYQEKRKKSAK